MQRTYYDYFLFIHYVLVLVIRFHNCSEYSTLFNVFLSRRPEHYEFPEHSLKWGHSINRVWWSLHTSCAQALSSSPFWGQMSVLRIV